MIKESWQIKPLGEVLTFQRGFDITKDEQQDGPYPVYSSSGPKSTHRDFKVRGPGVIIGRKGSLGTVFFSRSDYWPHDTTLWVKDFHGNCPKFAYYFLQTMGFERLDAGASNPSLNRNHIHTIPVRWPLPPIQERIAGILSAYDDLIENNQRRIKILEEMARSLYREWFVNFRFPGHEKVPLVDSPLGPIPKGWEVKTLGDLVQFKSGFAFKSGTFTADGEYRLVTIRNVQDGSFNPESDSRVSDLPENLLPHCFLNDGDILLSLTGNVGRVCLVYGGQFLLNQRVSKLVPMDDFDWAATYCMFRESEMRVKLEQLSNGVAQQNLSPVLASRMDFTRPPRELRQRFATLAEPMVHRVVQLSSAIRNLRRTRDLMLPRLLSGQPVLALDRFTDSNRVKK